jgi:ABC-type Fe3+ transport system permease subunit
VFRHRFDPSSLVAAVLFFGIAARYLTEGLGGRPVSFPWAVPAVVAAIALIALLRAVFQSRRRDP